MKILVFKFIELEKKIVFKICYLLQSKDPRCTAIIMDF